MGFTRGDQSKMVVARYQDLNNQEGGDTWEYQGTTVLEVGNNATNGYFLDKPNINLDIWRGPGAADQCSHRVYVELQHVQRQRQERQLPEQDQLCQVRRSRPDLGPDEDPAALQPEPGLCHRGRSAPGNSEDNRRRHRLPGVAPFLRPRHDPDGQDPGLREEVEQT